MTVVHVIHGFHDRCREVVHRLLRSERPVAFADTEGLCQPCTDRLRQQLEGIENAQANEGRRPAKRLLEIRSVLCVAVD